MCKRLAWNLGEVGGINVWWTLGWAVCGWDGELYYNMRDPNCARTVCHAASTKGTLALIGRWRENRLLEVVRLLGSLIFVDSKLEVHAPLDTISDVRYDIRFLGLVNEDTLIEFSPEVLSLFPQLRPHSGYRCST